MDKELREYLDKNMATKDDIRNMATKDDIRNMATKDDIAQIRKEMATKTDIDRLDKKINKVHKDLLGYLEHIDNDLQEHIHNTEIHLKVAA